MYSCVRVPRTEGILLHGLSCVHVFVCFAFDIFLNHMQKMSITQRRNVWKPNFKSTCESDTIIIQIRSKFNPCSRSLDMCVSQRRFVSSGVLQYPGVDLTISDDIAILDAMLVHLRTKLLARQWQAVYQSRTAKNFSSRATETEMDETSLLGHCATDFPYLRSRQNLFQT